MMLHAHHTGRRRRGRMSTMLAIVLISSLVLAACGRRHSPPTNEEVRDRAENRLEDVMDRIDATDEQRAQFGVLFERSMPTVFAMRDSRQVYANSVKTELMMPKPDAGVVRNLIRDGIDDNMAHVHKLADAGISAHAILTPEQRAEIGEAWDERVADRKEPSTWMLDAVVKRGLDEIEATDAQYEFVLAKKDEFVERGLKLMKESQSTRAFFRKQLTASKVDAAGVHAQIDGMSAKVSALAQDAGAATAEFAGTLSDEQRRVIAEELGNR